MHVCPTDHKHGDTSTCRTHHGCKCTSCLELHAKESAWRRRVNGSDYLVPAGPTERRLQALAAIGWGCYQIGDELGTAFTYISEVRAGQRSTVLASTARRIAAFYEQASMRPRAGAGASRARTHARKQGWLPPLAYDDIEKGITA